MSGDYVIGIDCSTSAAKAVVWDTAGCSVAEGRSSFPVHHPRPSWAEQRAEDWWSATAAAISEAVRLVDRDRIAGLAVTHQRETFVCLDERDRPVRPAMLWMDVRASAQVAASGTQEIHRITGKPPNPTPAWYKLLWLREHEPETLQRSARVVDVQGYLVHRLTGRFATSWGSADPLGLIDMATSDYDDGLLASVGLSSEQLAELHAPGEVIGHVQPDVATELGLPQGVPVVAGVGDGQSAGLGCNVTTSGRAYLNLGTGVVSGTHSDHYAHHRNYRTMSGAVPGTYVFETFIGGGTHNVNWFVENFAGIDAPSLQLGLCAEEILETAAARVGPGAEGLLSLPYWTGALTPYWDGAARGAFVGVAGMHGKAHVYRAILESIALEQRLLTEGAEETLPEGIAEIMTMGGGSQSRLWCQILADVLQRPVRVMDEPECTALGAGIHAASAVGLHPTITDAASAMSRVARTFDPDAATAETYEKLYQVYREIYPSLREVFTRLAEATGS
jgi:xylulokinase